jgi:hypothetical protein
LKDASWQGLGDSLLEHVSFDVAIDLHAPVILLPVDPCDPDADTLVIDLGHFKVNKLLTSCVHTFTRKHNTISIWRTFPLR